MNIATLLCMDMILHELTELRDMMSEHPLFTLGILLVTGFLIGKLVVRFHLPEITGYIIAGLLLGDSLTGIVPYDMHESLRFVTDLALGLIALTMGGEFYYTKLKRIGRDIVVITSVQMTLTFVVVTGVMYLLRVALPFALLLGVIATASDPVSTGAKVQSLRVRGRFVDYLYGVIALDDAAAVAIFGVVFAVVVGFLNPAAVGASALAYQALREVFVSIFLGLAVGFIIHAMTRRKQSVNEILIITLGIVLMETAVAVVMDLSPLLMNMAAGAFLVNASPRNHRLFRILEPLTPPVYALFFVIAGTKLDPKVFLQLEVLAVGLGFVLFRGLAKYLGTRYAASFSNAGNAIEKYLGPCLIAQGGVAIGLALLIQTAPIMSDLYGLYQDPIQLLVNVVLVSVFINELIGPPLSKFAILKALEEE